MNSGSNENGKKQLNAIVRLDVTFSAPNFITPWQNREQFFGSGSGVVIDRNWILTNAHNITNATFISVSKPQSDAAFEASVAAVDHDCDLALIDVVDPHFFDDIAPMEIGVTPPVRSEVQVAGYPIGGVGLSITQGIISRIEECAYAHSSCELLTAQLDAAINPGNSGGPVIFDGRIAGIAFQGRSDGENLGYMIPTEIIRHFLADLENDRIDGFPSLFFKYFQLTNPDMRRALKMRERHSGVLLYDVAGPAGSELRTGDVLLGADRFDISNSGNVRLADGGQRTLNFLFSGKQVGETMELHVLRNGKEFTLRQPMVKLPLRCRNIRTAVPSYYIAGGLVFTALSENLMADLFSDRMSLLAMARSMDLREGALRRYLRTFAAAPDEELVILQTVLTDKVNNGIQACRLEPVEAVNGEPVRNLRHLAELVDACRTGFITFKLANGIPIMLDARKLREATPRILERYRIPADRSLA